MERELTSFQSECESQLRQLLRLYDLDICSRSVVAVLGLDEYCIHGWIQCTEIEFYIYEDEAQIMRPKDIRFEALDYSTPGKLMDAFLNRILELLPRTRNGRHSDRESP